MSWNCHNCKRKNCGERLAHLYRNDVDSIIICSRWYGGCGKHSPLKAINKIVESETK